MKLIELGKSKTAKIKGNFVIVDDEDYEYLNQFSWHCKIHKKVKYAERSVRIGKKMVHYKMHREIMGITNRKELVDHEDHDGLNCQKHNLRKATKSNNNSNRRSIGVSKYLGVSPCKRSKVKKWKAQIFGNSKNINLGRFEIEEDAARAYDEAAKKYHGEFANLNFK